VVLGGWQAATSPSSSSGATFTVASVVGLAVVVEGAVHGLDRLLMQPQPDMRIDIRLYVAMRGWVPREVGQR
jgi:hypothetical protein